MPHSSLVTSLQLQHLGEDLDLDLHLQKNIGTHATKSCNCGCLINSNHESWYKFRTMRLPSHPPFHNLVLRTGARLWRSNFFSIQHTPIFELHCEHDIRRTDGSMGPHFEAISKRKMNTTGFGGHPIFRQARSGKILK